MNRIFVLLKAHTAARLRRCRRGFSSPRRVLLSLFVVLLAVIWIGQTLASMLLREPFAPEMFRRWVSLPLMLYFFWHVIRVAWKRPETAIEWSPEEQSLIVGGPFTASEQLLYRFSVIFTATLPKALLTTLALWPDLAWSGPFALLLALVYLELFRMVADLAASCCSARAYAGFRAMVLVLVATGCVAGYQYGRAIVNNSGVTEAVEVSGSQQVIVTLQAVRSSPVVSVVETPFLMVADVVAGRGTMVSVGGKLLLLMLATALNATLILWLYRLYHRMSAERDRRLWAARGVIASVSVGRTAEVATLPGGRLVAVTGPLVWRQARRAQRYVGSLLISMGIPAMLSCIPLFSVPSSEVAFVAVVCGVLFYTFVLLPEAIKFDFRLDMDHLTTLKLLPMTSARVVLGQLVTPVLLALGFQLAVILFAGLYRDVGWKLIAGAVAVTSPLTVVFVALDNLVFLLYPHRPTQEGFEAFVRTILKFTGKSLLLVLAGALLVFWAPLAASLAARLPVVSTASVFYCGLSAGVGLVAVFLIRCVVVAYERFDVSLDGA
ncbi:MAG: hypothetical protein NXI04_24640 [Planctomycetaceae bacterium]|nr:hypothetical protein [Planctomycetaceae bacterium]